MLSINKELDAKIASADSLLWSGDASAPEQVQELHESALPPREALAVEIDRGRHRIIPHYEALTRFAQYTGVAIRDILSLIEVENGVVEIECCLTPRLTTLEGLEHLATVKRIDLALQPIASLRGIPLQALEHLSGSSCDIKGGPLRDQRCTQLKNAVHQRLRRPRLDKGHSNADA
jgi:hypothetical protein